jgi:hypothetical protein
MRLASLLAGALLLASCDGAGSRPDAPSNTLVAGAQCSFQGSERLEGKLYVGPSGDDLVAELMGARVGVWVQLLAPGGAARAKVQLRSDPAGPTLRLDGWMELSDLRLFVKRDVRVVPDHVWITAGSPVAVLGGDRERVRLQTTPYDEGFDDLATETTCAVLALASDVSVREKGRATRGVPHHPAGPVLVLHDEVGKPVQTLRARHHEVVTLYVLETRGAMSHVLYDDWLRIDGWVKTSDLVPGPGDDCDDCRRGPPEMLDTCFGHPIVDQGADGCTSHGERLVVVKTQTPLRAEGRDGAAVVGSVDRGAHVYVVNSLEKGWVQIAPATGALVSPDHLGFWAKADDIE